MASRPERQRLPRDLPLQIGWVSKSRIRDPKATQKKSALIARTSLNIRSRLTHLPKCTYIGTVQPWVPTQGKPINLFIVDSCSSVVAQHKRKLHSRLDWWSKWCPNRAWFHAQRFIRKENATQSHLFYKEPKEEKPWRKQSISACWVRSKRCPERQWDGSRGEAQAGSPDARHSRSLQLAGRGSQYFRRTEIFQRYQSNYNHLEVLLVNSLRTKYAGYVPDISVRRGGR